MKYFLMNYDFKINGISIPSLNGDTVKNYQEFFNNGKCKVSTFYDKNYEFDYLRPQEEGEVKNAPKVIADFHMWIGEEPRKGLFYPISKKFKELLEGFNQSEYRFYNGKVLFKGDFYPYFVWRVISTKYKEHIDYSQTLFNNLNSWRRQMHDELVVKQFDSHKEMKMYFKSHWRNHWNYERLVMKSSFRNLDYCYIFGLGSGNVVSERLKIAIEEAGLTGIRFEPVPIPIEFADEVE